MRRIVTAYYTSLHAAVLESLLNLPFVVRTLLVASYCLSKALSSTVASLELRIFNQEVYGRVTGNNYT